MISFIQNIFTSEKPEHVFLKIILFLAIIYIYLYLYKLTSNPRCTENFSQKEQFVLKEGDKLFDDFYAEIYDALHNSEKRNDLELIKVVKNSNLNENESVVLDIGSRTGNTVNNLNEAGYTAYGIDKSNSMVEYSQTKYPNIEIKQGDVLDSMAFEHNTFTHILSTYFTVYYIQDKSLLFKNCYHWLQPNSYFVLHLVDLTKFTKIIPVGKYDTVPQKPKTNNYRTVDTLTVFKDFKYKAYYQVPTDKNNKKATLSETFTDNITKHVRQNEHTLYMEPMETIVEMVKKAGFVIDKRIHMKNINDDENQFLYFFKRPSGMDRLKNLKDNRDTRNEQKINRQDEKQKRQEERLDVREKRKDERQERQEREKKEKEKKERINRKLGIYD
tara:strand:+ start:1005 stop:2162 length:1158 start_codon:yes stop_codon:yes gene_type:complete